MEYLLIDYENVASATLAKIPQNQFVYLFVGATQTRIGTDLAESILNRAGGAKLIRIDRKGKNALDFHIAFYIGQLSEKEPKASFKILSKDKGYDALIRHLNSRKINCVRIESVSRKTLPKRESHATVEVFAAHLKGIGEKVRPKKVSKLKAYLKSWTKKDQSMVEPIFNELLSKRHIEIEGEKVKYLASLG
jgi:PIN domain